MSLGKRIKEVRKENNLNQTEFAEKIGSTIGAMSRYEIDKVIPNGVFIKQLCTTFYINEEWLKSGKGDKYNSDKDSKDLAEFTAKLLEDENEEIKYLMYKLLELSDSDFKVANRVINSLILASKSAQI
jgi:transcriptional regulator with XRE-family HTH domain